MGYRVLTVRMAQEAALPPELIAQEMAFYRKYTEGMLRRYVQMSMESGKVPSLLGKEMFRGNVTSCRVGGFDDAVIFVHDVKTLHLCVGRGSR